MKFSFDLDQLLISHVKGKGMTNRKWQWLAGLNDCVDANQCRQRWEQIHNHTGIEYKCLISSIGSSPVQLSSAVSQKVPEELTSQQDEVASEPDHDIVIHVRDEARQISRDFSCSKRLLLSEMSYFQNYLENTRFSDDIDISVHCDVNIFDWLIKYIKGESNSGFSPKTIVSILISSEFLKMTKLVEESVKYFVDHADEIVQVPIDLSCVNNQLLDRLAATFSIEQLHRLKDPNDKILYNLYKFKLKHLLEIPSNQLSLCALCGSLYTAGQYNYIACCKAKIDFDIYGKTISRHQRDHQLNWDLNLCLTGLRAEGISWCDIFWKFWAVVTSMTCSKCGQFSVSDFGHCRYHACEPVFSELSDIGRYQCCKMPVLKFDTIDGIYGCRATSHSVNTTSQDRTHMEILLDRRSTILTPFASESNDVPFLSRLGLQSTLQLTSKLMSRTTMLRDFRNRAAESTIEHLVQAQRCDIEFSEVERNTGADDDGLVLSDDDSSDAGPTDQLQVLDSQSESDDDTHQQTQQSRTPSSSFVKKANISFNRRSVKKKRCKSSMKSSVIKSPTKHRTHKLDTLREDDRARMQFLVHKLADMRHDKNVMAPIAHDIEPIKSSKFEKVKKPAA